MDYLYDMCYSTIGIPLYLSKSYKNKKTRKTSAVWKDIYNDKKLSETKNSRKKPRIGTKYQAKIPKLIKHK